MARATYRRVGAAADVAQRDDCPLLHGAALGVDVHSSMQRLHCPRVRRLLPRLRAPASGLNDAGADLRDSLGI